MQVEFLGGLGDGFGANGGIRTEGLAFDEGDAAMAEADKMFKGKLCGESVIECDVGETGHVAMAGDGDDVQEFIFGARSIDGDEAFDGAALEKF